MPGASALTLADGIEEYMGKPDIKPTTRASYKTKLAYLVGKVGGGTPLFDIDQLRFVKIAEAILADNTRHDKTKGDYTDYPMAVSSVNTIARAINDPKKCDL